MAELFSPITKKPPIKPKEEIKPLSPFEYEYLGGPIKGAQKRSVDVPRSLFEFGGIDPTSLVGPSFIPARVLFSSLAKKFGPEAKSMSDMIGKLRSSAERLVKRMVGTSGATAIPVSESKIGVDISGVSPVNKRVIEVLSRGVALRNSLARELEYAESELGITLNDIMKSPVIREYGRESMEKMPFEKAWSIPGAPKIKFVPEKSARAQYAARISDPRVTGSYSPPVPSATGEVQIFRGKKGIAPSILPYGGIRRLSRRLRGEFEHELEPEDFLHEWGHHLDFETMELRPIKGYSPYTHQLIKDPVGQVYDRVKVRFPRHFARREYGEDNPTEFFSTLLEYPSDPLDWKDTLRAFELTRIYKPLINNKLNAFRKGTKSGLLTDEEVKSILNNLERSIDYGILGQVGPFKQYGR